MHHSIICVLSSLILVGGVAFSGERHAPLSSPDISDFYHGVETTTSFPPSPSSSYSIRHLAKPSKRQDAELDTRPTPEPTGSPSDSTTVHITSESDFSLLLPGRQGELVSDSESDGVSYCTPGSSDPTCANQIKMSVGFITAAAFEQATDGAWIQVTGCMDPSKSTLDPSDAGGQLDVRFPNGAQCTFGGYGASFIELVEPALNRFCIRCCKDHGDQNNCNSHRDRLGCETAIPGKYDFPEIGVSCS